MGKQSGKKKKQAITENNKSPRALDKDDEAFVAMARELRDEGNKLFQRRDHRGAMSRYDKALKLLPRDHADVSCLRSNLAACHMQMGLSEYPRAIRECCLALQVTPGHSKALLKRARCYEALNRLDLALRDASDVLSAEPNNVMALEVSERVRLALEKKGLNVNESAEIELPRDYVEPETPVRVEKKKRTKKRNKKKKSDDDGGEEEKKVEDKAVVEEEISSVVVKEVPKRSVKLVLGEDIRWAQMGVNCSLVELREVVLDRFPSSTAVLIKYRDREGDLVTITSDEELRLAEASAEEEESQGGSIRFYIAEVDQERDPLLFSEEDGSSKLSDVAENGREEARKGSACVEDWIIQFARMFKSHVGFESDSYLSVHEVGMKLYSEAMEETVTSSEAQDLFDTAGEKFQELTALALFNWGNVHMSRARKKVFFNEEEDAKDSVLARIKSAYDWAQEEYVKAGKRYEEAIRTKPDFYEGFLALGQQQFERAKLSWYHSIGNGSDSAATLPSTEILELYNKAEDNMEKGMQIWEESEEQRLGGLSGKNGVRMQMQNMGLDWFFKDMSEDEAAEQASNMRSQINLLWGTMLYERSIMEFKLGLPVWHECLEVAIEKFGLAGASPTDTAVMVKNHCSNHTAVEGLGFKIDEIVQAWNEMYEAKKLQSGVPSFRLEPLLRRRVSKLYHALELA